MYSPALVLISALSVSVWSLGAAAAPLPYHVRSLSVRSFVDNDSGIQSRMVNDINILEQREGEFEAAAAASSEPPSSDSPPPQPKHPKHHHYTVQSLNAYLSTHSGHHHHHDATKIWKRKHLLLQVRTQPMLLLHRNTLLQAQNYKRIGLGSTSNGSSPSSSDRGSCTCGCTPVMRRAFHWDDMEDLD
ncbi:hypothetical protein CPB84DRAFT_237026 [Gymnopilus junonius]|uniref:Uncharacterized protein n=1 Tax=Gymnopilus junonius TaxID=109634 RepID=A0A9P5NCB6_GYMJU|nr:hypothetical protein CPB84DRAFT_237026 [Gymnopilus junonius]